MPLSMNSGRVTSNATVITFARELRAHISETFGLARLFRCPIPCLGRIVVTGSSTDRAAGTGTATVLVVEDDRAVRILFTRVLQAAGYEVIACENGALGLETARRQIDKIDAVVTDAVMPGLQGPKLIARLRALRPHLPAILVSGNFEDGDTDRSTVFLTKPVSPGMLTRELRRLLSA